MWRRAKLSRESSVEHQSWEGCENLAVKKKVVVWGKKALQLTSGKRRMDGVWTRTHITRGQVERIWGNYSSTQKIYNSIDNCGDLCINHHNLTYLFLTTWRHILFWCLLKSPLIAPPMDVEPTPHANPPSILVDSSDPAPPPLSMPLQNPNPQSEDDFISSDDVEDDEHYSSAAKLKFAVLSEVNS